MHTVRTDILKNRLKKVFLRLKQFYFVNKFMICRDAQIPILVSGIGPDTDSCICIGIV